MDKTDVASLLEALTVAGESHQAPRVLFVRADTSQKAFIARALKGLESLSEAMPLLPSQLTLVLDTLVPLEQEAAERGLLELAECARVTNALAADLFEPACQSETYLASFEPLVRLLSTLLLRVYITGSDAGGSAEREQAQRLVTTVSPRAATYGAVGSWIAH